MDVLDRALNLGRALAGQDAYFTYPKAIHETDEAGPGVTPGTVMSVSESDGTVTSRLDVVPRDEEAIELYGPEFVLSATGDAAGRAAAERLQEALAEGSFAELDDGLAVTFTRLPPAFADLIGERLSNITVQIGPAARRPLQPWNATLRASTDVGTTALELAMSPASAVPEGWETAFSGEFGGLTATLLHRRTGTGHEVRVSLRYTRDRSPARAQLAALTFLKAASGAGELTLSDASAPDRSQMRFPTDAEPLSDDARGVLAFIEAVRDIEKWTGVELDLPGDVSAEDARVVAVVAQLIRNRGRSVTWHNFNFNVNSVRPLRDGQLVRVEMETSAKVLGHVVELGYLRMDFTDYKVVSAEPARDHPGYVTVRAEPRNPLNARIFEQLAWDKTAAKKRPPPPPRRKGKRRRKRK